MFEKARQFLRRITGISTPVGGLSWEAAQADPPYDTKVEFLIAATVANSSRVGESFILTTTVRHDGTVADFLTPLRLQRAIGRAQAEGLPLDHLRPDESEPLALFDWNASQLPLDLAVSKICHGRALIAVFDTEMPAAKAAIITKESVRERPEIQAYLHERPASTRTGRATPGGEDVLGRLPSDL